MARTQPYQVEETDRDLLTLAEKLKLDYPTLKAANPSITSISPGQFINRPLQQTSPVLSNTSATGMEEIQTGSFLGGNNLAPTVNTGYYQAPASMAQTGITGAPPVGYGPGSQPTRPPQASVMGANRGPSPIVIQAYQLKNTLANITDPSQLPPSLDPTLVAAAGYTPAKMLEAGYVLQSGKWVRAGANGVAPPQTNNNWETNDALRLITFNRNAKNRRSRFETTLKWAKNAWKRKKLAAKGHGRTEPAAEIRMDTPSTTLDLILGS
jgi:hypothetical protein